MGRFIGRKDDLGFFEDYYVNPTLKAVALIGRRRVGKTYLIQEFVKDKDHFYIQFLNSSMRSNLDLLGARMAERFGTQQHFANSIQFFDGLRNATKGKRIVIVFDEYQFMSSVDDTFSSLLQEFLDHHLGKSMVIISGSSVGMMDREFRDKSRPLFGRMHRYYLEPMKITDCRRFHPDMSDEDQMRMYLTFGGIPMYYDFPKTKTYAEFIERYALGKNSPLNLEGEGMINREFAHGKEYESILDAISNNRNTVSEIVVTTELDRSTVNHHMNGMMELGLIERLNPMAGAKSRAVKYRIKDRMLAFYHYVLRRCQTTGSSFGLTYAEVKDMISTFHGRMFEMQCADYLLEHFSVKEIGTWYGSVPIRDENGRALKGNDGKTLTENTDIDIVAYVRDGKNTVELFCECKFTGSQMTMGDVITLESRMKRANVGANSRMVFFSRSGFDSEIREYAECNDVILVDLKKMLSD